MYSNELYKEKKTMDSRIKLPFIFQVSGPTQAGKSSWVAQLIRYRNDLLEGPPLKHIYWFTPYESLPEVLEEENDPIITLIQGLPWEQEDSDELLRDNEDEGHVLYVIDDFAMETKNSKQLTNYFTKYSHHLHISIIQIVQSLFWPSPEGRTRSLNVHYFCLMRNARDNRQVKTLARQITTSNKDYDAFMQAYFQATRKPYSYLLVSLHPRDDPRLLLRSEIFPEEAPTTSVYLLDKSHMRP